jgi:hypothetical protein
MTSHGYKQNISRTKHGNKNLQNNYTVLRALSFKKIKILIITAPLNCIDNDTILGLAKIGKFLILFRAKSRYIHSVTVGCKARHPACLLRLKGETHQTRFDNAARFFSFLKLIKQPMKGNFKRYVDQITQNIIALLNLNITKTPGSKVSVSENRKTAFSNRVRCVSPFKFNRLHSPPQPLANFIVGNV